MSDMLIAYKAMFSRVDGKLYLSCFNRWVKQRATFTELISGFGNYVTTYYVDIDIPEPTTTNQPKGVFYSEFSDDISSYPWVR